VVRVASAGRRAVVALALFGAGACSDDITGLPTTNLVMDRGDLLPAVTDARLRLVPAIQNAGVRDRIAYDMKEIEAALNTRDGQKVRYHVRVAGGILLDYRVGLAGVVSDGPDVGGIALTLHALAVASGGTFDMNAFR
jgi:hypothetical protein